MKIGTQIVGRGRAGRATRVSAAVLVLVGAVMGQAVQAADYDETISGEFSDNGLTPTSVTFGLGSNIISGVIGGAPTTLDRDYMTFTIAPGQYLASITVLAGTQSPGRSFFGIQAGSSMTVDPESFSAAGLLGWTLLSPALIGTDVLDDLGAASPPLFPPFPGATGFTGPLWAGSYTTWLQDEDSPVATYKLSYNVAAVPEPASWALMLAGLGGLGGLLRRRRGTMQPALA